MRYKYQINRSKTVETKFVVVWANGTYIPIPVFIYDKSLACAFEYYNDSENAKVPFILMATKCNNMPDFRQLDFGPIAKDMNHTRTLTLANLNLMPLFIDEILIVPPLCNGERVDTTIQLIPDQAYDIMTRDRKRDYSNENKCFSKIYNPDEVKRPIKGHSIVESSDFMIAPNSMVTFNVDVLSPTILEDNNCSRYEAKILFKSSQSPDFEIPISYLVIDTPTDFYSMIIELPAFYVSEKEQVHELSIKSNLEYPMHIIDVESQDPSKISIEILKRVLQPDEEEKIIRISTLPFNNFNTYLRSLQKHLLEKTPVDSEPCFTYFDVLAYQSELKEWEERILNNLTESVTMVDIRTNIVKNITIPIKKIIKKPELVDTDTYDFGMVEVDTERRGTINIFNPSTHPMEVSVHLAPTNYLDMVFQELMSDESLIKWMILCQKVTFFEEDVKKRCQEFLSINNVSEENLENVTDFFFRNYFNFINNNEVGEDLFINFISDQHKILRDSIKNISDSTKAVKPEVLDKCYGNCEEDGSFMSFLSKLNPFSGVNEMQKQSLPKIEVPEGEQYEEIVETIKVRLHQWMDEYPQNGNDELKTLINTRKQNFFIEQPSQ